MNLNTADATTLAKELDGIGPAKAQAIVEYRQKNGPFRSAEDLLKVEGIGQKVLDQNRGNIRLEKAAGAAPARRPRSPPAKSASKRPRGLEHQPSAGRRPGPVSRVPAMASSHGGPLGAIQYHAQARSGSH